MTTARPAWGRPLAFAITAVAGLLALSACEGTPAASQVTVVAGDQHLTLSPGPAPTGVPTSKPPAVSFQAQVNGGGSATEAIQFRAGETPLAVDSVQLDETGPRSFEVISDECTGKLLAPGEACTVLVRFVPPATGTRDAELIVRFGNNVPALQLGLKGLGMRDSTPTPKPTTTQPTPTPTPTPTSPSPSPTKATPIGGSPAQVPFPSQSWIVIR